MGVKNKPPGSRSRLISNILFIVSGLFLLTNLFFPQLYGNPIAQEPYSMFINRVENGNVARASVGQNEIIYELKDANAEQPKIFRTNPVTEMDGFAAGDATVIVLAATNRPETLDPALLRPGRFDRQVLVDRPDLSGRQKILEIYAAKVKLDLKVDLKQIATRTPGFAGADLANLVNEAALLAARNQREAVI